MEGISWEEFRQNIQDIYRISNELSDGWQLIEKSTDVGGAYLFKKTSQVVSLESNAPNPIEREHIYQDDTIFCSADAAAVSNVNGNQELVNFEYHILYQISYGVPYLSFNGNKSDGSSLTIDEAWSLFKDFEGSTMRSNIQMTSILTQMEHPLLFKPFLTLHPCRTAEILNATSKSQNKVLTFISSIGPSVNLAIDLRYAKYYNDGIRENDDEHG